MRLPPSLVKVFRDHQVHKEKRLVAEAETGRFLAMSRRSLARKVVSLEEWERRHRMAEGLARVRMEAEIGELRGDAHFAARRRAEEEQLIRRLTGDG